MIYPVRVVTALYTFTALLPQHLRYYRKSTVFLACGMRPCNDGVKW